MGRGSDDAGLSRVSSKEKNNHPQGRTGSKVEMKPGPVRSVAHNPTKGGGINRAPKGAM